MRGSKDSLWIALSIAVHVLLIGIPIALSARRAVGAVDFETPRSS
jgi:ABC-type spermidine/putrescine transport system permease subunit I